MISQPTRPVDPMTIAITLNLDTLETTIFRETLRGESTGADGELPREFYLAIRDETRGTSSGREANSMLKTELIDLLNFLPVEIAPQCEGLIQPLHGKDGRFTKAGVDDIIRETNITIELSIGSWKNHFS